METSLKSNLLFVEIFGCSISVGRLRFGHRQWWIAILDCRRPCSCRQTRILTETPARDAVVVADVVAGGWQGSLPMGGRILETGIFDQRQARSTDLGPSLLSQLIETPPRLPVQLGNAECLHQAKNSRGAATRARDMVSCLSDSIPALVFVCQQTVQSNLHP